MSGIVGNNTGRGSGVVQVAAVAADAITGAEIADDAVDSEHYVDGSIDNAHINDLGASKLTGTIADARFPATLPAASGANLTALNATNLGSGTVPTARLGSGTASSSTFLRGDQTYAAAGGITSSDQSVCKAWVNFDGTGTVSIRDSYGVSSITDRGTGVYTVNFSSAFGNSSFNGTVSATIGGATNNNRVASTAPVSTTTAYLNTWEGSSANDSDVNHICGSYFGDS